MNVEVQNKLSNQYGYLLCDELLAEIASKGKMMTFQAGQEIMDYGQQVAYFPLILSGAIKVMSQDKDGDEMLLYFLETGDTCAFTLQCCLGNAQSKIRAEAETDVELLMIEVKYIDEWMAKYQDWRGFVIESYSVRINELLEAIDQLAFHQMDQRLLSYLKNKSIVHKSTKLDITHQEIANDLHSSRVVISRLLKKLEADEKVKLYRNALELLDF